MSVFAISAYGGKRTTKPSEFKEMQHLVYSLQKQLNGPHNWPHKCFAFVDLTSRNDQTNLNTIVDWHNSLHRDIDVSISVGLQKGDKEADEAASVRVLHRPGNEDLAGQLATAIASGCGLVNRGAEPRRDNLFLSVTHAPAILIRLHFPTGLPHFVNSFTTLLKGLAAALAANAPGQVEMSLDSSEQIGPAQSAAVSVASE
jgi:hypothetical protein